MGNTVVWEMIQPWRLVIWRGGTVSAISVALNSVGKIGVALNPVGSEGNNQCMVAATASGSCAGSRRAVAGQGMAVAGRWSGRPLQLSYHDLVP